MVLHPCATPFFFIISLGTYQNQFSTFAKGWAFIKNRFQRLQELLHL